MKAPDKIYIAETPNKLIEIWSDEPVEPKPYIKEHCYIRKDALLEESPHLIAQVMKYIDADRIREEIERLENEGAINKQKASENNDIESYVAWDQQEAVMGVLIRFIDSLQQEQPEVDLEKEINRYLCEECAGDDEPSISEIARHFAVWGEKNAYKAIMKKADEVRDKRFDTDYEVKIESVSEDLEEAVEKHLNEALYKWSYDDEDGIEQYVHDAFIAGAEWRYQKDRGWFAKLKAKEWMSGYDDAISQFVKIPYVPELWYMTKDKEYIGGARFDDSIPADVELYYRRRTRNDTQA